MFLRARIGAGARAMPVVMQYCYLMMPGIPAVALAFGLHCHREEVDGEGEPSRTRGWGLGVCQSRARMVRPCPTTKKKEKVSRDLWWPVRGSGSGGEEKRRRARKGETGREEAAGSRSLHRRP